MTESNYECINEMKERIMKKILPVPHTRCCHRSQTSQVMPCWRLPTTLPHAMHRSDILNFHREYSKMNDAERISTTYIPSNRYLKRKWTKDN